MINCTIINNETGEILRDDFNIIEIEDEKKKKETMEYLKEKNEFETLTYANMGNFYLNFYLKLPKIDKQYIFRFIYLCTYLKFNDNRLMRKINNKNELIKVCDLMHLLQLGKTEYNKTRNILVDNKLIKINEDRSISIDDKISFVSKVKKDNKDEYSRMFKIAIQELYKNSRPKEHKRLALLIELLPFIHYKYNIVCKNPECELMEDIKPFTIQEIQEYSKTYTDKNLSRFKKNMLNIFVGGQKAMMIVEDYKKKFIIVNPKIYYKGNDINNLRYLINLFRIYVNTNI
ncbi:hypothetical protein [Clostridium sardiniense]|uniref:hypothetical protein n=1 Tax=Clostridium sardiniense TaxID=29369 RepID=UPI00195ACECF|nr:hypothetical protein [Clostridium sardiniense]MBM7836304.1 hypothetical protein [Clostridium sardiniense]